MGSLVDFSKYGHLEIRRSKNYAFVCCPLMDYSLDLKTMRSIYRDFKKLEIELSDKCKEIIMYTHLNYPHIMRIIAKLGYTPFHLSLQKNVLWFKKETKNV